MTDEGIRGLAELKSVQTLDLTGSKVTDAGLVALKNLREVRTLYLANTQVTDLGLKELKHMKDLQTLQVSFAPKSRASGSRISNTSTNWPTWTSPTARSTTPA